MPNRVASGLAGKSQSLLRVCKEHQQQSYASRAGQLLDRNVEEIRARRTVLAGTMNARNSKNEATAIGKLT